MPTLQQSWGSIPIQAYSNNAVSNEVTSSTTETAFNQWYTFPSGYGNTLTRVLRFKAMGIISTGLLNLGFTFRVRWGGTGTNGTVIGSSGGISVASSLSDGGWWVDGVILVRNTDTSGQADFQGIASFQGGALTNIPLFMPNASTFSVDNSVDQNLYLTAQWSTNTAANSIQMRSFVVDTSTGNN